MAASTQAKELQSDLQAGPRVLLVDDDPTFRLVARAALEDAGLRIDEAEDGQSALAKFRESPADLVLLDIVMPGMDGYDTCAELRSLPGGGRTPIVMLTGMDDRASIERAYHVGATDFISKPVNYDVLTYRLRHILRANRLLADFDALTGLPNRALMVEHVERALKRARRSRQILAILFLDLDHFKRFNETLGHGVGDEVLRQVADRLGSLRSTDYLARNCDLERPSEEPPSHPHTISRFGGDEFIVLLPEIGHLEDGAVVARRIQEILARPYAVGGDELHLTVSIGISAYPLDGEGGRELLARAELAMSHAKEKGRGRYQFYRENLNLRTQRRFSIEGQLRRVLERGELEVHYQPKLDIRSDRLAGMEALVRWPASPEAPSPAEFVPIAEQTGLIFPMGDFVFRTACARTAELGRMGLEAPSVAINLSAAQFMQEGVASRMAQIVEEARLDPALVELEITEGVLLQDTRTSIATLLELREIGFRIAMDDFGTGYSSLAYLQRFPLHAIKMDRSFIRDLVKDQSAAIARAVISLGHTLGMKVVAEGVEQPEQLELLRTFGCDEVQGYLISAPLPFQALVEWLSTRETSPGSPLMQGVADSLRRRGGS